MENQSNQTCLSKIVQNKNLKVVASVYFMPAFMEKRQEPQCQEQTVRHSGGSVMQWGLFFWMTRIDGKQGACVFVKSLLKSQSCVSEIKALKFLKFFFKKC